ncbi:MAG: MFS transporter [Lautropia sp.]|nr:MFS transporter [Lautropia sp.]
MGTDQDRYFSQDPAFPARAIIGTLFVGAFFGYLNETLLNVALTPLMQEFDIPRARVQWLTTGFLLVMGGLTPITASLIRHASTRTVTLATLATFVVGSLICAAAGRFEVLLAGRLVQAASAALMVPLLMNAILAIYPPGKRGRAMSLVAMIFTLAPAIGPTLSGFIVDHLGWRALFLFGLPFVLLSMGLTMRHLRVDLVQVDHPRIDLLSALLAPAGFGCLVYAASEFASLSGTAFTLLLAASVLLIALFCRRQLRLETPLLDLRAFAEPQFRLPALIMGLSIFVFLGLELLLPMYMQQVLLFSGTLTGLVLLPASVGEAVTAPLAGILLDRKGGRAVLMPGALLMVGSLALLWWVSGPQAGAVAIALAFGLFGAAVACAVTGETHAMNALPRTLHPHGTAIISTINPVAGALGAAFFVGATGLGERWSDQPTPALAMQDGITLAFGLAVLIGLVVLVLATRIRPVGIHAHAPAPKP